MSDRHRGDGDRKRIRAEERLPFRGVEQKRLNAKLNRCGKGRKVQTDIGGGADAKDVATRACLRTKKLTQRAIRQISAEGEYAGDIETVGAKSENSAVSKEESLNRQRDSQRQARRLRAQKDRKENPADGMPRRPSQKDRKENPADGMPRRPSRKRHVKHHRKEGKRRGYS